MRFQGRVVLVSGAAGNLGRAVAVRLASEGARLVLLGRDESALRALAAGLGAGPANAPGGGHLVRALDLTDGPAVRAAVEAVPAEAGRLDAVCALAGGFAMGSKVHETAPDIWRRLFALNLETLLPLLAAAVPPMLEQGAGRIVTVGAHAALKGMPGMGPYCAAKSAVMRVTESAAAELRGRGVNVNGVLPTIIDTPQNRAAMPKADPGKWVAPEKLAAAIAFLASDDAEAVHGALLPVIGLS